MSWSLLLSSGGGQLPWTPPQCSKLLVSSSEHVPVAVPPLRCSCLQNVRGGGHFSVISSKCLFSVKSAAWAPTLGAKVCHLYYYSSGFNKVTLQSTHWSIQTLLISGGDSSCSWVFYSCTGPKCGVGVDLVDCNAVGGGHVATSIDQSVRISACGALALEEYKQSASVQPLLCNS